MEDVFSLHLIVSICFSRPHIPRLLQGPLCLCIMYASASARDNAVLATIFLWTQVLFSEEPPSTHQV